MVHKILVTGGAGFIGSALVRYLLREQNQVLALDSLTYAGNLSSLPHPTSGSLHSFAQVNVCDRSRVDKILEDFRPHWIIHLAAESHVDRSIDAPQSFIETNIVGTYTMLEAARHYWNTLLEADRQAFRFLHVSTDEVYGTASQGESFTEANPYNPSSPYAASKAAADHLARSWYKTFDLPVIVSNCSNNFGPFQFPEKLIPLAITNLMRGLSVPIYGDGSQVRDWLFVEDHVRALHAIVERGRPGETYIVGGGGVDCCNLDVVKAICAVMDKHVPLDAPHERFMVFVADRLGHDIRYAVDSTKIQKELGWVPEHGLAAALEKTVAWYLENTWWWTPLLQKRISC